LADDDAPVTLSERLGLDAEAQALRLAFYGFGEADRAELVSLAPICDRHLDEYIADFYAHLLRFPALESLLRSEPGRVAKLQGLQRSYFQQMVSGRTDEGYFESRLRVGDAHQRLGVAPQWYIGAFGLILRLWLRVLAEETESREELVRRFESLIKVVFLDMSLALDTYILGGFVDRDKADRLERATAMAEDALRVKQNTERLKDDLSSMVVHDLKNPVNGIAMMVQLALRKGTELPEAHRGYLLHIDRTCREMLRLIQNLLEISQIEDGKMPVTLETVTMAEIAAEVALQSEPPPGESGRSLRVEVDPTLPPVIADRGLLRRILSNLVINALRHSGSSDIRVEATASPGEVTIKVIDRGAGIAPDDVPRLFEKFRSVRRSPSDTPIGDTGLGLPFCKLAVELMGGRIGVESAPGEGAVFWLSLPSIVTR
jgi:signal transduction histidine kinase